jgi:fatty-acyl-CoA synthase
MRGGISQWVTYWAQGRPKAEAVVFDGEVTTWSELAEGMERGARALAAAGVGPGDRVAVMLGNRPHFYEVFFAIARLGAVFVPINVRLSSREVEFILSDAGVEVLITEHAFASVTSELTGASCSIWDVDGESATDYGGAKRSVDLDEPLAGPDFDDLLAILYTSGTTGTPKGAMHTHANFHFSAQNLLHMYGFTQEDRHLVVLPLCFTGGIVTLSQPVFLSGGTIVLERTFDPQRTLEVLHRERVTVFFAAPALLQLLRLHETFSADPFSTVRLIVAGAAPVPAQLLALYQALGVHVGQGYGLTEGGAVNTFLLTEDASRKIGSVGRACMFNEVRVVDEHGSDVAVGERGEILLRGSNIMVGYWNNEAATVAAFAEGGWLRTGDVGVLDGEGFLTLVDRVKDMVITGGMNVYPAEVEAVLFEHEAIAEVAVVGIDHEVYGETVAVVVAPRPGATIDLEQVRQFCAGRLADYKIPRLLMVVDVLPRNTSGKVLKYQLREQLSAQQVGRS